MTVFFFFHREVVYLRWVEVYCRQKAQGQFFFLFTKEIQFFFSYENSQVVLSRYDFRQTKKIE